MNARRSLLRAAAAVNIDQPILSLYDTVSEFADVPVDDAVAGYEGGEPGGHVVFSLVPGYETLCYRFCILGHAFRARGYEPVLLRDDGTLPADLSRTIDGQGIPPAAARYLSRRIPEQFGIKTVDVGDLVDRGVADEAPTAPDGEGIFRGVDLSPLAASSLRKHLKVYQLDFDDPAVRRAYARFAESAALLVAASEALFDSLDPTAVVVNESAYVQGGAPFSVARRREIPAYTQTFGYRDQMLLTSTGGRATLPQFAPTDWVRRQLDRPLTPAEREEIDDLIQGRKDGTDVPVQYVPQTNHSVSTDADTLVGVFTNLLWDASLSPDQSSAGDESDGRPAYADVFQWIADTIEVLGGREDVELVVKTHPAEAKVGTRESVTGWLAGAYGGLPGNVTLLEPDTEVNTYRLLEDLDLGIVYNTTVGLEMAYEGDPVVVTGETHYRGFGFTHDPGSPKAYRQLLEEPAAVDPLTDQQELARRYAHLLLVRRHIPFPYISRAGGRDFELSPVEHDDLAPGTEPWDAVVDAVVAGREILRPEYFHSDEDSA